MNDEQKKTVSTEKTFFNSKRERSDTNSFALPWIILSTWLYSLYAMESEIERYYSYSVRLIVYCRIYQRNLKTGSPHDFC